MAFPRGIIGTGATPGGRGPACENTQGPAPEPGPRPGGSLPSASVPPRLAPTAGQRRAQLQAATTDSKPCPCESQPAKSVHRPLTCRAHHSRGVPRRLLIETADPREPNGLPCGGAVDQTPACLPASPLIQLYHSPESTLDIAAHLLEQPHIPLEDGLLDPGDLAADLRVELGRAGFPSPVVEHRPGPIQLLLGPGDSDDFDPAAALAQRLPEAAVYRTPGPERRSVS